MWAPTSRHTNTYSHAYTTCTHLLGNPFKSISTTHFECTYSKTVVNIPNQRNQLKNCFRRMVEIPSIHAHFSCHPLKSFLIEAIPSCIVLSHKKGLDRVEFMDRSPIARCCKRQLPKFRVLCSRPEKFGIFETIDLFGGSKFRVRAWPHSSSFDNESRGADFRCILHGKNSFCCVAFVPTSPRCKRC